MNKSRHYINRMRRDAQLTRKIEELAELAAKILEDAPTHPGRQLAAEVLRTQAIHSMKLASDYLTGRRIV